MEIESNLQHAIIKPKDVIGQPIDIGDIQVVPVQGKETKKLEFTLTDTELPKNELALTTGSHELAKHKGSKRQPDKWSIYPERSILDIIMATDVSLVSMESEENTCLSSTPLSKRKRECEIDDLSSTSKKQCSKIMKQEKKLPKNELALTTGSHELAKHKGSKHQPDKWSIYPERSILDIIMATDIYVSDSYNLPILKFSRFKLHLLIKDDTGETKVMLLDTIAEPILGVSAEVLLDGSLEEIYKIIHLIVDITYI
ncbi:hypothetical protein YC2023_118091 [Brassica napus]